MNRAPSVAYDGEGAGTDADAEGSVLGGGADDAVGDGDAADGAAEPPALQAAVNAATIVNPVAARNRRRVSGLAEILRTMASISCSRDGISSPPPARHGERCTSDLRGQDQVGL